MKKENDFITEDDRNYYFNKLVTGCVLVYAGIMLVLLGMVMFNVF